MPPCVTLFHPGRSLVIAVNQTPPYVTLCHPMSSWSLSGHLCHSNTSLCHPMPWYTTLCHPGRSLAIAVIPTLPSVPPWVEPYVSCQPWLTLPALGRGGRARLWMACGPPGMHGSHKLSAIFKYTLDFRCKYETLGLISSKKERIRVIETVQKSWFLIIFFATTRWFLHFSYVTVKCILFLIYQMLCDSMQTLCV